MWQKRNKYKNTKVIVDGVMYDSKKEAKRGMQLNEMQAAGQISNLERQVSFELIPAQKEPDSIGPKGGKIKGKTLERAVFYIADFVYEQDGERVVEDTKGMRTPEYIIKRKLMLWRHGIQIKEI